VTTDGKERILYSFAGKTTGSTDGENPVGAVTVFKDALYGTTVRGGADNRGTVFEVQKNGKERVIRSLSEFDGYFPYAGLTVLDATLYGAALRGGGPDDGGTVFAIKPNGTFSKLYEFTGKSGDGKAPNASLVVSGGTLFGTTRRGGTANEGTVFKLAP
jgi:uncharacterized repeat protein (TIGR03803 family)